MRAIALAVVATLSSLVAGTTTPNTRAYLLRSAESPEADSAASSPVLPFPLARAIVHQRLSPSSSLSLQTLLASTAASTAIAYLSSFGRPVPALFSPRDDGDEPNQRVVFVEGLAPGEAAVLDAALDGAAFSLDGTVAAVENARFRDELTGAGVHDGTVVSVDVSSDPSAFANLIATIPELRRLAASGITETLVLAFADAVSAPPATLKTWWSSSTAPFLTRRQVPSEAVISESDPVSDASFSDPKDTHSSTPLPGSIPACFASFDACVVSTSNCSLHGQCRNKWGPEAGAEACWACHCLMSADGTQWGGDVCHKIDVSVPFWLLAGTSLVLIWAIGGAVGLLYSVGGEKLPGVIGAGVSRKS